MARRAVVIGGGWAGCAAAWRLAQAGWKVALFEKSGKLGGRASSFFSPQGWEIDNGQHLFLGAYEQSFRLLESLGTLSSIDFQAELRVDYYLPGGACESLNASHAPGPLALWDGLRKLTFLDDAEKKSFLKFGIKAGRELMLAAMTYKLAGLENQSVETWLQSKGQPASLVKKFWEPLCLAALNAPPPKAQAAGLAAVLARGFLRGAKRSALAFSKVGLRQLLEPSLEKFLEERGGKVYFHEGIQSLKLNAGLVEGAETEGGKEIKADAFVLALPHALIARLFPEAWANALGFKELAKLPSSPILSVQIWSKERILPSKFGAFLDPQQGSPNFHWAFDRNAIQGQAAWPGVLSSFVSSAAEGLVDLGKEEILQRLFKQLEHYFRWKRQDMVLNSLILREKRATPLFRPGDSALRLNQNTIIKNMSLAGDWTNTKLPATIESAVASGVRAAGVFL